MFGAALFRIAKLQNQPNSMNRGTGKERIACMYKVNSHKVKQNYPSPGMDGLDIIMLSEISLTQEDK